jgi:hypothetical protein
MFASCVEREVIVSFPPHFISPTTTPNILSQLLFQVNCYPVCHSGHPPSVSKANKSSCCHPLLTCCMEKAVTVSSPLIEISPPPFNTFLHIFSFQFNCCLVGHASHPPSANQGNMPPHHHPCQWVAWRRRWL